MIQPRLVFLEKEVIMNFELMFSLTAAVVAVGMDLSMEKVKNGWIYTLWLVGLVYGLIFYGWSGFGRFFAGSLLPIIVLFPLFWFRMLGPGDIKLLSALGGVMGANAIFICIIQSFLCGAVLSLGVLILCGNARSRLRYFTGYIQRVITNKAVIPYYKAGNQPENIHFTVAILMGVILYTGGRL